MKLLHTFNEEGFSDEEIRKMQVRRAVRVVLFDNEDNIAILHVSRGKYYSLPGGGVKKTETFKEGYIRECWEETGCKAVIEDEVGRIDEIRGNNNIVNRSVCYISKITGNKGTLNLDNNELLEGIELLWVDIDKAIDLVSDYQNEINLYSRYAQERDVLFLKEVRKIKFNRGKV